MSEQFDIKSIELEIKDDQKGEVAAVFSVFDSVDSDGDIVKAGSVSSGFKSGDVPMVWAHKWDMPIGKGKIIQDKDKATFSGNFFMDTESGREAYKLVKAMGDLQQWSFGFKVNDSEYGKFKKDGSDDEEIDVRYLKDLTVYEVSPVLVGANQQTYTMAIKSNTELLEEIADAKTVMTTESMNQPDPNEESEEVIEETSEEVVEVQEEDVEIVEEAQVDDTDTEFEEIEQAPEEEVDGEKAVNPKDVFDNPGEAMNRSKELSCEIGVHTHEVGGKTVFMPCKTHDDYDKAVGDKKEAAKEELEDSEKVNKTFSEEVKDVLAALDNLITRAKAISHLRHKDGRKLGAKATEALRTVQDDLSDAWAELDSFVDEFGDEVVSESEVEEQPTDESEVDEINGVVDEAVDVEVEEEIQDENSSEEEQAEETPVSEASEESEDNSESADDDFDAEWVEGQRLLSETVDL